MKDINTGLVFDDYAENEKSFDKRYWTYLCEKHAVHGDPTLQENACSGAVCGVEGCEREAVYYYDFNEKEIT